MEHAELQVDLEGATRSESGLVSGWIALRVGERLFPAPRWHDAIVVVLSWWAEAVCRLLREQAGAHEVCFMEGPYRVKVQHRSIGVAELELIEAGLRRRIVAAEEVAIGPLVASIIDCGEQVLELCHANGWWSRDEEKLSAELSALRREIGC